jgi:hypothetical protein
VSRVISAVALDHPGAIVSLLEAFNVPFLEAFNKSAATFGLALGSPSNAQLRASHAIIGIILTDS